MRTRHCAHLERHRLTGLGGASRCGVPLALFMVVVSIVSVTRLAAQTQVEWTRCTSPEIYRLAAQWEDTLEAALAADPGLEDTYGFRQCAKLDDASPEAGLGFYHDVLELGSVEPVGDAATARSVTAHLHAVLPIRSRGPETWSAFEGTLDAVLDIDPNMKAALYNTHSEDHRGRLVLLSRPKTNEHVALFIYLSH